MPENDLLDSPDEVLVLKVPYSDFSRFDATGRLKELAKAAEPVKNADFNPIKRFIISTAGIFFLMIGLIGLTGGQNTLISVVCVVFAILIIWTFVARPEIQKRKAAPSSADAKDLEVSIAFSKNHIVISSPHIELKKDWSELAQYKKTKKGVHINFTDNAEAYLPLTAFYGDELKILTALLQNKKTD